MEYRPRGNMAKLFVSQAPVILVEGPANTGKSYGILWKILFTLAKHPGAKAWIGAVTRAQITDSVLATFENKILPLGPLGRFALQGAARRNRHDYRLPNGSEIVTGGLNDPGRLYGSEWDIVYICEVTGSRSTGGRVTYDQYQQFHRAMRNKHVPHPDKTGEFIHQIIMDCNPAEPTFWANVMANDGKIERIVTRHRDNPAFTTEGENSDQARLDLLTGVRRARLRDGKWCAAEGQVWESFDTAIHIVDDVPRDADGAPAFRMWVGSQDWGFRAPGCFQLWGVTEDGDMYRVREVYHTGKGIDWWISQVRAMTSELPLVGVVCDSEDPASIDLYRRAGIPAVGADKRNKLTSLNQVRDRMDESVRAHRIGERRGGGIYFVREGLQERDRDLQASFLPCCTEEEIPAYVLREVKPNRGVDDETDDSCADHGCDAMRYAVRFVDAYHPSRAIRRSDAQDSAEATRGSDVPDELLILERGTARDDGGSGIRWPWSTT